MLQINSQKHLDMFKAKYLRPELWPYRLVVSNDVAVLTGLVVTIKNTQKQKRYNTHNYWSDY